MAKQFRSGSVGTFVLSDQDLHCPLQIHEDISDQEVTSIDPDKSEMAQMYQLIWIYIGQTLDKT
jgi:hypothetical protein